jgi:hypothetical protein
LATLDGLIAELTTGDATEKNIDHVNQEAMEICLKYGNKAQIPPQIEKKMKDITKAIKNAYKSTAKEKIKQIDSEIKAAREYGDKEKVAQLKSQKKFINKYEKNNNLNKSMSEKDVKNLDKKENSKFRNDLYDWFEKGFTEYGMSQDQLDFIYNNNLTSEGKLRYKRDHNGIDNIIYDVGYISQRNGSKTNPNNAIYGDGTIDSSGCGIASARMAFSNWVKDDPNINDWEKLSNFAINTGTKNWGRGTNPKFFSKYADYQGLKLDKFEKYNDDSQLSFYMNKLDTMLTHGPVVALGIDNGEYGVKSPFTKSGHYVVINGINEDSSYSIKDPFSDNNTRRHFDPNEIIKHTVFATGLADDNHPQGKLYDEPIKDEFKGKLKNQDKPTTTSSNTPSNGNGPDIAKRVSNLKTDYSTVSAFNNAVIEKFTEVVEILTKIAGFNEDTAKNTKTIAEKKEKIIINDSSSKEPPKVAVVNAPSEQKKDNNDSILANLFTGLNTSVAAGV